MISSSVSNNNLGKTVDFNPSLKKVGRALVVVVVVVVVVVDPRNMPLKLG